MKKYYIDLSRSKTVGEIHQSIKEQLEFPEWYGENLDALWDMLTGHMQAGEITLSGLHKLPNSLQEYKSKLLKVFENAKELDGYSIIVDGDY